MYDRFRLLENCSVEFGLFRVIHRARLADQVQLDLSGVLDLFLDLLCHLSCDQLHSLVVNDLGLDHYADLTSRLNCKRLVNALEATSDLLKLLGRLRYRTSYGQNVLQHSIEVAWLAGMMADELGVDGAIARRAGLLHDIGKAFPQDMEGSHVELGVNAAKKYKESAEVIHAIEAHHNDVEPKTIIAILVQAADAVSAARPGARREDMENYIKRLQKLEEVAVSFQGVDKAFAIQAGREIRVMVKPEVVNDEGMKLIAREMAKKIEEEVKYPGQIKLHLIRETRAVDYAK